MAQSVPNGGMGEEEEGTEAGAMVADNRGGRGAHRSSLGQEHSYNAVLGEDIEASHIKETEADIPQL